MTTRHRRTLRRLLAHTTAIGAAGLAAASVTLASPVAAAASTASSSQQPTVNATSLAGPQQRNIIMSDGRICNPRWGC
jgi:hypothetical protein